MNISETIKASVIETCGIPFYVRLIKDNNYTYYFKSCNIPTKPVCKDGIIKQLRVLKAKRGTMGGLKTGRELIDMMDDQDNYSLKIIVNPHRYIALEQN